MFASKGGRGVATESGEKLKNEAANVPYKKSNKISINFVTFSLLLWLMEEKDFLRDIIITPECIEFINNSNDKIQKKIAYLIDTISKQKIVNEKVVKKIVNTDFYELRIKVGNQYRIVMFTTDHPNFQECTEVVLLNGFHKKATKDYSKAIKRAENILTKYQTNINNDEEE